MSSGWSVYVIALIVITLVGCAWLLWTNRQAPVDKVGKGEPLPSEHDGIQELNNPLPAWWTWLFVVTLAFGVMYLIAYPGMGAWAGVLGWTSQGQYQAEVARAEARYGPIFEEYAATPIPELLDEERAIDMGSRLFRNHCATCHGSDARGGKGYPNLTDDDWLHGGAPEQILTTIRMGRIGNMPALGAAIGGEEGVRAMAQYVLSLSGREHDAELAARAAPQYATVCAVCHGPEGKGKPVMGAPNLTDDVWLHGGRVEDIEYQIANGRINQMPAHQALLSEEKIHLLAAYVYSLSRDGGSL